MNKKGKKIFKNRMSSTGKALLASIMSMVLCLTMLFGTTLAWFSDTASNQNNRITTGILDVQLLKYDGTEYKDATDVNVKIFDEDTVWEPNRTEVVLLQVKNNGNLAMDYNMNLVVTPDDDNKADHEEVMEYAVISGFDAADYRNGAEEGASVEQKTIFANAGITSWQQIVGFVKEGCTVETGALQEGTLQVTNAGALEADAAYDSFLLAVHMKETAGKEYMDLGLTIDVTVEAKQQASEEDSFGAVYDEVSWEEIQINKVLNTNLLKDSGFNAGLVSDASKGWVKFDAKDKDGNPLSLDMSTENGELKVTFANTYEKTQFNTVAYQIIDLSEFVNAPAVFEGYQYHISGEFKASIANNMEEDIYVAFIDKDGNAIGGVTPTQINLENGVNQVLRVKGPQANWTKYETTEDATKTIPEGTEKIKVYFVIANRVTDGTSCDYYLDNLEFKITKKAATQ